jgi:hypothetical protein
VDNPNPIKQEDVFDVDAKEFTIAPHSHRKVQLTFKPASIEVNSKIPGMRLKRPFAFSIIIINKFPFIFDR